MLKKCLMLVVLLFPLCLDAQEYGAVPGLYAWWKASPGSAGTRWYDRVGTYHGTFAAGLNATNWGGSSRQRSQGELRIGGSGYVDAGFIPKLRSASAFTFTAWLKQTTLNTQAGIFQVYASTNAAITIETWNDNTLYFAVSNTADSEGSIPSFPSLISANTWFHLTCVFNGNGVGNAGRMQVYINGKPISLTFIGTIPTSTYNFLTGNTAHIGHYGTGAVYWNGAIDDVRLYNRPLTNAEVVKVMNDAPPIGEPGVADITVPLAPTPGGIPNTSISVPNNLVARWKGLPGFSSGKFWYNVIAPQHGTLANGAVFQASGRQGGSQHLFCDGVDDYANITPPPLTGGKYTIMFWAKDDFSGTFGFNLDMTYTAGRFALSLNGGNWTGVAQGISIFVSGPTYDLSPASALPLNTWSHIAVTLNAATNVSTGYINGNATGTGAYTDTFGGAGTLFRFCTRDDLSGSYSKGLYDDLRLYDAELTAAEVRQVYEQSIRGAEFTVAAFLPSIAAPQGKGFFNFFGQ